MTQNLYSIILPTYNQLPNLPIIIYLLQQLFQIQYTISIKSKINIQIIIIDDNSPDGTLAVAKTLTKIYNNIIIVERPAKLGLGSAYRDGLKHSKGNFIIIMDADLSHHPKYIPNMIAKLNQSNADIVTGTRYLSGGGVEGWTYFRKFTSRVANFIASWVLGSNFSDLTGSFRLYRRDIFQELIGNVKTKGYAFQMEILIRAWKMNKIVVEQPIVFVDRLFGKSKLGPNEIYLYLKGIFQLFIQF